MLGISVYAGLDLNLADNINYLKRARELGITDLFFSLHIPEVRADFLSEAEKLLTEINKLNFRVTADISKKYFNKLNLAKFEFASLRLDFGFSNAEIADLSRQNNYKITLNASTINQQALTEIISEKANLNNLEALHNYYPRPETGLGAKLLQQRTELFHSYGIEVAAFVPAKFKQRLPLKAGLPTLEVHRCLSPLVAGQDLLKLGIDRVYIGDSQASKSELADFALINSEYTIIPIETYPGLSQIEKNLLKIPHYNRYDPGEYIIRSATARSACRQAIGPFNNNKKRFKYAVTIDNQFYQRYQGDLQILKKDYPADKKVNLVAEAGKAAPLIEKISAGEKFKFKIAAKKSKSLSN